VAGTISLYSADFVGPILALRVATAKRFLRPVAFVLFTAEAADPDDVAAAAKAVLRGGDVAGWFAEHRIYALVLEDTSESGAVEAILRLREQLDSAESGNPVAAGIACYPTHALEPDELTVAAFAALGRALSHGDTGDHIDVG
jgi:hypothetical protein